MNNKKQIFAQIGTMLVLLGVFGVFEGAGGSPKTGQPSGLPTSFTPGARSISKTATGTPTPAAVAAPGGAGAGAAVGASPFRSGSKSLLASGGGDPAGSVFTPGPLPPTTPPTGTQPAAPTTPPPAMPPLSMEALRTTGPDAAPADGGSTGSAPINPAPGFGGTVATPPVLDSLKNAMKVSVGAHVIVSFDDPKKGGFQGNDFRSKILEMMLYLKDQDATILDGLEAKEFAFNNTKDLGGDGEVIRLTKDSTEKEIKDFVDNCFPDFPKNDKKRTISNKHRADLNDVQYKLKEKIGGMEKNSGKAQVLRVLIDLMEGYSALDIYVGIGKNNNLNNSKTLSAAGQMAISAARNNGDPAFREIIKKNLKDVIGQYNDLLGEIPIDEKPDFNKMIPVDPKTSYTPILETALKLAQQLLDKNLRYIIGERCPVVTKNTDDDTNGALVARLDEERCAYRNEKSYWEADFGNGVVSKNDLSANTKVFKKDADTASVFTEYDKTKHKLRIYGLYYQLSDLLQNDTNPSSKELTVLNNLLLDLDVDMVKKDFNKDDVVKRIQTAIDTIASTKINPKDGTNIRYGELLYTLLFTQCVLSHLQGPGSDTVPAVENFIKLKTLNGRVSHAYDKLFEILRKVLAEFSLPLWTLTQYFRNVSADLSAELDWYETSVAVYRYIAGQGNRVSAKQKIQQQMQKKFGELTEEIFPDASLELIMAICDEIKKSNVSDTMFLEQFSKELDDINLIAKLQTRTNKDEEKNALANEAKDFAETARLIGGIDKIGYEDISVDTTTDAAGSDGVPKSQSGQIMLRAKTASLVSSSSSSVGDSSSDVARSLVEGAAAEAGAGGSERAGSMHTSDATISTPRGSQAGAAGAQSDLVSFFRSKSKSETGDDELARQTSSGSPRNKSKAVAGEQPSPAASSSDPLAVRAESKKKPVQQ